MNIVFIAEESSLFITHKTNQHLSQTKDVTFYRRKTQRTHPHLGCPGPLSPHVHSMLFPLQDCPLQAPFPRLLFQQACSWGQLMGVTIGNCRVIMAREGEEAREEKIRVFFFFLLR